MRKKERTAMALALSVVLSLMAGCSQGSEPPSESKAETQGSETLASGGGELSILAPSDAVNEGTYAMIDAFEKKYGIKVSLELSPNDDVLVSRAATGDLGDIVDWHAGSLMLNLGPDVNLVDITNESYVQRLNDIYKECVSYNGKIYGVPTGPTYAGGIFYNKKIYEELGLEVPKTWEQFLENCGACKKAGYEGLIGTYGDPWTSQLLLLSDFYYVNDQYPKFASQYTEGKVTLADCPAYVRSVEKLASQKEVFNEDYLSTSNDDGWRMMCEGTGGHLVSRTREYVRALEDYPEAEEFIGYFAVPGDEENNVGATVWMPHGYYIAGNAPNMENAKLWQEFVTTEEALQTYAEKSAPMGAFMIKDVNFQGNTRPAIQDTMNYVNEGKFSAAMEFLCPVKGTSMAQICVQIGSGEITPQEGIEALHEDNRKSAEQLGLDGWK